MIVLMGDLNAKIGSNNASREEVMGMFGAGVMNDYGERLCDFCSANQFIITGTLFPHKEIHKLTFCNMDHSKFWPGSECSLPGTPDC